MTTNIEAHEQNIGNIFSDAYEFEIPPYQRPYAWETEQARELLEDLLDAADNRDANGGVYFLGSIVLVKQVMSAQAKVIDGQQRLTTLTILLSVIRDLTSNAEIAQERRTFVYQRANSDRGLKERYRLLPRERDRPFFLKYVQNPGATNQLPDIVPLIGSQRRIAENTHFLRSKLVAMPEDRRNSLIAFVLQHCYLVVVAVATADAARRIFTVLNARGLDLTPTDILKADLLERAAQEQETVLAGRWEEVERAVGRERLVELFGHIRMIYERDKPRLALEEGFRKLVVPFSGDADEFISNILEPIADAFLLISDTSNVKKQFGAEVARALRSLERIDNKDWVPAVLLHLWKRESTDIAGTVAFICGLERVAYFLLATRAGVNERIARFSLVMESYYPKQLDAEPGDGMSLSDAEQYLFVRVLDGPLYTLTRVCKPVLQRLDEALSSGGASYDELVSIEHVLPQTVEAGSEWEKLFPDEALRSEWAHCIANLVFLTARINTRASNWDFDRKKREYFSSADGSSPFVITQGVLQTHEWTPEHLDLRQQSLLLKLCEVWRLDETYVDEQTLELTKEKGAWKFTDSKILASKRGQIVSVLQRREGVDLSMKGARCWDDTKGFRAVCSISKRYTKRSDPYWYAYTPEWRTFLLGAPHSFIVLGCVDKDRAYAVPTSELEKSMSDLNKTPERHWHIFLRENQGDGLDLVLRTGACISLDRYALELV